MRPRRTHPPCSLRGSTERSLRPRHKWSKAPDRHQTRAYPAESRKQCLQTAAMGCRSCRSCRNHHVLRERVRFPGVFVSRLQNRMRVMQLSLSPRSMDVQDGGERLSCVLVLGEKVSHGEKTGRGGRKWACWSEGRRDREGKHRRKPDLVRTTPEPPSHLDSMSLKKQANGANVHEIVGRRPTSRGRVRQNDGRNRRSKNSDNPSVPAGHSIRLTGSGQ